MKRLIRLKALQKISEDLKKDEAEKATNEAEKATDEKPKEKQEEKIENKEYETLYSVLSNTPAGSFEITNDKDFNKAVNAVTGDIKNTFKDQPNVDQIIIAFVQSIDAKNNNEIKNAFNMIAGYKKLQKNTEKQAFYLVDKSLTKQS